MDSNKDDRPTDGQSAEGEARRDFLKNVGKAGVTVPAVALLLAASEKSASAQQPASGGCGCGCGSGSGCGAA